MKYVLWKVEELAHKLWGGADGLSLERQRRNKLRDASKQKQFTKKITGTEKSIMVYHFLICAVQKCASKLSFQYLNPASLMLHTCTSSLLQERKVAKCMTLILTLGPRPVLNVVTL